MQTNSFVLLLSYGNRHPAEHNAAQKVKSDTPFGPLRIMHALLPKGQVFGKYCTIEKPRNIPYGQKRSPVDGMVIYVVI
jgi:hypothetical protein